MTSIISLSAGINLGATLTTYYVGKRPVKGFPDTRPVAVIYRVFDRTRLRLLP